MADPNAERTFIMIKPDGVQRGLVGKIIKRFETKGFKLVAMKFMWVSGRVTFASRTQTLKYWLECLQIFTYRIISFIKGLVYQIPRTVEPRWSEQIWFTPSSDLRKFK